MPQMIDKLSDKAAEIAVNAIVGASWFVLSWLLNIQALHDPFYHDGWLYENKAWTILFFVVFVMSLALSFYRYGLIFLFLFLIVGSVVFAIGYGSNFVLFASQEQAIWVLHGLIYSALPGFLSAAILWIYQKLKKRALS